MNTNGRVLWVTVGWNLSCVLQPCVSNKLTDYLLMILFNTQTVYTLAQSISSSPNPQRWSSTPPRLDNLILAWDKRTITYSMYCLIFRWWFVVSAEITNSRMSSVTCGTELRKPNNNSKCKKLLQHCCITISTYSDIQWKFTQGFHALPSTVTQ